MCDNCDWINTRALINKKDGENYQHYNSEHVEKLQPIIIVHGYSDDIVISKGTECDLILKAIKMIAVLGYQALLRKTPADDVVALTVSQLEDNKDEKLTLMRGAILMDNNGRVGCVSALTALDHPILLSRRLMDENTDVTIVQENIEGRRVSDLPRNSNESHEALLSDIRSWGVIARDQNENLAAGHSIWSRENDKKSLNVMLSVPGCGLSVENKACCSVFGDEEMIYLHAPARKIMQRLRGITSPTMIRNDMDYFLEHNLNTPEAVVYLGANNEPLIASRSICFPWAYCYGGILKYGYTNIGESCSEKIALDMPLDCVCQKESILK